MHHPPTPKNIDLAVTQPSDEFKQEVLKVLGSIVLFILVYLGLVVAAIFLAVLAGYGGIALMSFHPSLMTIMLGLGLLGLGVMVLIFLVKFIFKQSKANRSHLLEVKREDQPELFSFVQKLTSEIGAPFPKRIYFSSEVNASVFYDSGFWSMFLPVRKNLQIGLGLVNAMTLSELKAVLAHEFGHFSQRSMRLGSYVYNVNHVIFNMLYDNQGYGETLEKWGSISSYFAIFSNITVGVVRGIQWILQQMYGLINKNYMSLSRQMEFHADAVAAASAGANQLVTALLKLDMASLSLQRLLQTYNSWVGENVKAKNMYPHHREVMNHFARDFKILVKNGLPEIDEATYKKLSTNRITIDDQWASHPSTEDRVARLRELNINTDSMESSAWLVINNVEQVQSQLTEGLYDNVVFKKTPELGDQADFYEKYYKDAELYKFSEMYERFYDGRSIAEVNYDVPPSADANTLQEILTADVIHLPKKLEVLGNEIKTLEAIQIKNNGIKTFDFEGQRYRRDDADKLLEQLKREKNRTELSISHADVRIFALAYHYADLNGKGQQWKDAYRKWISTEKKAKEIVEYYQDIMSIVAPVYQDRVSVELASSIDNQLRLNEKKGKQWIDEILRQPDSTVLSDQNREILSRYLSESLIYFSTKTGFNNEALSLFTQAMGILFDLHTRQSAEAKKLYLDWQAELLG